MIASNHNEITNSRNIKLARIRAIRSKDEEGGGGWEAVRTSPHMVWPGQESWLNQQKRDKKKARAHLG